jgi:hypothetical protein
MDYSAQLILRRLIAQAAMLECWEARLQALRAIDQDTSEEAIALAAAHAAAAKSVAYLLGQLRATPRSRVVPRSAGPQIETVPRQKPWEIRADDPTDDPAG